MGILYPLKPPTTLERLELDCCLPSGKLPNWVGVEYLPCLSELVLYKAHLTPDPFVVLQRLPNLMFLHLGPESYMGKRMGKCDAAAFPKLQKPYFIRLKEWEEWGEVEEGAMACLHKLSIWGCKKLRGLPPGFQYLSTLQELLLWDMGDEFVSRLKRDSGEDRFKVEHIPTVHVRLPGVGKFFFEDL
ncbi:probable disease resistance protein RF45 [Amborella trichopoda]|uniref:probable disease resistance protein RF45 n=1 Tax=Amborella trichopoda TaxID=13333 RepID=UPI0009C10A93|nr:probable disease resistance protein RF45 [Amborella trichopoda]|eukprot:XP_020527194.1 probable disease resistance protein RF45 [Amborella trichopoda]